MGIDCNNICGCRQKDNINEENDLSYNHQTNQKLNQNNNNINIINLNNNNINSNPPSKDTIDFNNQVSALAKQYKNNIPKKTLNEKLNYNFLLKKNKTPKLKNNFSINDNENETKNQLNYN